MLNLIVLLILVMAVIWSARKFYLPTKMAQYPERYPVKPNYKISKKEIATVLSHIQRWRKEGKLPREEYDRLTDICLAELKHLSAPDS